MLSVLSTHKVFLAVQPVDFRCGIDALSALCRQQLAIDPFNGHYFIFRNRRISAIKILVYDSQGFWLCQKRLSKGTFRYWPKTPTSVLLLNNLQFQVLLQNGDPSTLRMAGPWR